MNYYISDLHLFHKNITKEGTNFDNRPFDTLNEMHTVIKTNWNSIVTNADHVYICGDVTWKENEEAISFISTLKGAKHLIIGNHDKLKDQRFKQLFVEIVPYKQIKDMVDGKEYNIVLSHFPIAFWYRQHREKTVHLYGHLHNTKEETLYQDFVKKINEVQKIKCIAKNVGCMMPYINYTPRTIEEILQINNNKKENKLI